jgi:hypothetical protein
MNGFLSYISLLNICKIGILPSLFFYFRFCVSYIIITLSFARRHSSGKAIGMVVGMAVGTCAPFPRYPHKNLNQWRP